jgi:hypothetical protein
MFGGIATLIGGGLSLFGGLGAAAAARANAQRNYMLNMGNAETQRGNTLAALDLESMRADIELGNARTNLEFATLDAAARTRNAERLRQFGEVRTSQFREQMQRQMRSFDQMQGSQRAAVGASGVTESGSPLEVMAESAAQMQLALRDAHNAASMERSETLTRAGLEDYGAAREIAGARAGMLSAERGYSLRMGSQALGRMSAESAYRAAKFGAGVNQQAGLDQSRGMLFSSIGGAFSGFADFSAKRNEATNLGFKF